MVDRNADGEVRAAGGAVWRRGGGGVEVLLVHRPRYDDWSLPKGTCEAGERSLAAALREVAEETGLACVAGEELPTAHYVDHKGRPKVVRYWAMTTIGGTVGALDVDEVDDVRWLGVDEARRRLSYPHDATVLRALVEHLLAT